MATLPSGSANAISLLDLYQNINSTAGTPGSSIDLKDLSESLASGSVVVPTTTAKRDSIQSAQYAIDEVWGANFPSSLITGITFTTDGSDINTVDGEDLDVAFTTDGNPGEFTVRLQDSSDNTDASTTRSGAGTVTFSNLALDAGTGYRVQVQYDQFNKVNDDTTFNHHDLIGAVSIDAISDTTVAASTTIHSIAQDRSVGNTTSLNDYNWTFAKSSGDSSGLRLNGEGSYGSSLSSGASTPTIQYKGPGVFTANLRVDGTPSQARNSTTAATVTHRIEYTDSLVCSDDANVNDGTSTDMSVASKGMASGVKIGYVSSGATTTFLVEDTTDLTDTRTVAATITKAITTATNRNTVTAYVRAEDRTTTSISDLSSNTFIIYPRLLASRNTINNNSVNTIYSDVQADDTSTYPPSISYGTPGLPTDNVTAYGYAAGTSLTGHGFSAASSATTTYGGGSGVGSSLTTLTITGTTSAGVGQTSSTSHTVTVNYEPRIYDITFTSGTILINTTDLFIKSITWQGFDSNGFTVQVRSASGGGGSEIGEYEPAINDLGGIAFNANCFNLDEGGTQKTGTVWDHPTAANVGMVSTAGTVYLRVTDGTGTYVYEESLTIASYTQVSLGGYTFLEANSGFDTQEAAAVGTPPAGDVYSVTGHYIGTLGSGTVTILSSQGGSGFQGGNKWWDMQSGYIGYIDNSGNLLAANYISDANAQPLAPTSISFSSVTTSQIVISWTDNSAIEDGFKLYRDTGGAADSGDSLIVTQAGNSYTNTSLSTRTPVVNAFTATVSSTILGRIDLSWSLSTTDSFTVKQSTASNMSSPSTIATSGTSLAVTGLSNNTAYYFQIAATTSTGVTYYYGLYAYNGSSNTTVLQGSRATAGTSTNSSIVNATTINPTVTIANLSATTWASTTSGTVTCTTTPNFSSPELDVKIQRGATVYETDTNVVATKNVATTQTFSKSNMVLEGAYYDIVVFKTGTSTQYAISDNAFTVTTKAVAGSVPSVGIGTDSPASTRVYVGFTDNTTNETQFRSQVINNSTGVQEGSDIVTTTTNSGGSSVYNGGEDSVGTSDANFRTIVATNNFYYVKVRAERVQTTDFTSTTTTSYSNSSVTEMGTVPETIDSVTFDQSSYVEGEVAQVTYTSTNLDPDESLTIQLFRSPHVITTFFTDYQGGDYTQNVTLATGLTGASDYQFRVFKTVGGSPLRDSSTFTINETSISDNSPSDFTTIADASATGPASETRDLIFTITNPNPDGPTATLSLVGNLSLTDGYSYAYSTNGGVSYSGYTTSNTNIGSYTGTEIRQRIKFAYEASSGFDEEGSIISTTGTLSYNGVSQSDQLRVLAANQGCFDLDSLILLSDNTTKKLHEIQIGDVVKSWNIPTMPDTDIKSDYMNWTSNYITGSTETTSVVTDTHFSASFDNYWYINSGSNYEFKVSSAHGIFVKDENNIYKFKYVSDFTLNDKLFDSNLDEVDIISIENVSGSLDAGWIDVEDTDVNYYSGILAHNKCFVEGTLVSMADGTQLPIEDIKIGDLIQTYDTITTEIRNTKVISVANPIHDDIVLIRFNNDVVNENTFDHPYYVKDKGWCSHRPELTKERYDIDTELLEVGDVCYYNDGVKLEEVTVKYIREELGNRQTYTIDGLESGNTFFANGIVVHNEGL